MQLGPNCPCTSHRARIRCIVPCPNLAPLLCMQACSAFLLPCMTRPQDLRVQPRGTQERSVLSLSSY